MRRTQFRKEITCSSAEILDRDLEQDRAHLRTGLFELPTGLQVEDQLGMKSHGTFDSKDCGISNL